ARHAQHSKGMRQKMALMRPIIHTPPVLLLDEPTSALDPLSAQAVHQYIVERRSAGDAIVISTHNLPEAEVLADRVAIIAAGRLRRQGTRAELCQAPDGLEAFALTCCLGRAPDPAALVPADTMGIHNLVVTHAGADR